MKKLTLDISKWRCGSYGDNRLGAGITKLLNHEGFMCCLGQFSEQLGVPKDDLLNIGRPRTLDNAPVELTDELSDMAIDINDNESLTTEERISALKELFAKHGFEIEVVGQNEHA